MNPVNVNVQLTQGEQPLQSRGNIGLRRFVRAADVFVPLAILASVAAIVWRPVGRFPTGLDTGNWLAVGRTLLGDGGKFTDSPFPPLVPILLFGLSTLTGPMVAGKVIGLASHFLVLGVAYFVAASAMRRWFAVAVATTVGLSSIVVEQLAFGHLPQHFAFPFLLLAASAFSAFLSDGRSRWLWPASIGLALVGLTHHAYFVASGLTLVCVWLLWAIEGPGWRLLARRTVASAIPAVTGLVAFLPIYLQIRAADYTPDVNFQGFNRNYALRYGIQDAPEVWMFIFVSSVLFLLFFFACRRPVSPMVRMSAAMIFTGLGLFVATNQTRLLPMVVAGSCIAFGLLLDAFMADRRSLAWSSCALAIGAVVPLFLIVAEHPSAIRFDAFDSARVVDQSMLDTAEFIDSRAPTGLVVVRQDAEALPIGWWFEGLTKARVAVGSYPGGLAYPSELEMAHLANRFFAEPMTGPEIARLAAEFDVELLVFRKYEWPGWTEWLAEPQAVVQVVYDDDVFMVLEIVPGLTAPLDSAP